jgi:hypothetical protein
MAVTALVLFFSDTPKRNVCYVETNGRMGVCVGERCLKTTEKRRGREEEEKKSEKEKPVNLSLSLCYLSMLSFQCYPFLCYLSLSLSLCVFSLC